MNIEDILELISRRRRQILVHSVIYYNYDESIISDSTWAKWAEELEELQELYPEIATVSPLAAEFNGFEHSSGFDLPLDNEWAVGVAKYLLRLKGIIVN